MWRTIGAGVLAILGLWSIQTMAWPGLTWVALDRPAPALPALDRPLRVTVFGTSLSAPPQTWPARLETQLSSCHRAPVTVQRVVGPGMGSTWALQQVDQVVATQPDVILLEFSINDADVRDGVSLRRSQAQHSALITALQQALPQTQIILLTMSPARGRRGWIRPRLAAYYRAYDGLARTHELGLVDLYAHWLDQPRPSRGLARDGLHPAPDVAVDIILPPLQQGLCPENPQTGDF